MTTFLLIIAGTVTAATDHLWRQSLDSFTVTHLEGLSSSSLSQVEALLQEKLVNDPICPVMDAGHPAQNIVTFMNYECIHFRPPDVKLGNLLKAYPQIAITNKLISYGSDGSIAFTRMALAVWQHQSEKFDAFHLALIAYEGMIDCYSIRAAMRAAVVHFTRVSPDTLSPQAFNRSLIMKFGLTEIPSLLIGDNVLTGSAKYSELEGAVNAAPKSS